MAGKLATPNASGHSLGTLVVNASNGGIEYPI